MADSKIKNTIKLEVDLSGEGEPVLLIRKNIWMQIGNI